VIRLAAGMPLLHVERPVMSGGRRAVKTLVDLWFTFALTVLALPVLVAVAVAIRLDSPGPVPFLQKRSPNPEPTSEPQFALNPRSAAAPA